MSETWHDSGVTDLYDMQDALGDAWARDRRAVIDEMARKVCPTQWREGGHMRYKGHTITWGEYVTRRHEIEDEEEDVFTVETWPEARCMDCGAPEDGIHEKGCAKHERDASACQINPCGQCDEDSDGEGPIAQAMRDHMRWAAEKWQRGEMGATREPADDAVNHPAHYQSEDGIECIDAIRAALGLEGFVDHCRGTAIKYAWRAGKKGDAAQCMRKAAWYLTRAAEELEQ